VVRASLNQIFRRITENSLTFVSQQENIDESKPMRLEDVVDRTLSTIIDGDAETMRRLSGGVHLKGTSAATNALLTRKETLHALRNRHTEAKRRQTRRQGRHGKIRAQYGQIKK
jgi:hypothetical protein